MKLTLIISKSQFNGLVDNEEDFVTEDIYLGTPRTIKDASENNMVGKDEYMLQITVDSVHQIETTQKLVKVSL